jgi:phospholipid/cholesterol/gamma-HCH transport system substrate-binding protein
MQGALLDDLLRPQQRLRVLLPETGVAGLARGASVEVLGTPAGTVNDIVIEPNESFYAEVQIDENMTPYIRRDSRVLIRRQFGIAGAAYLEITRGSGLPLDWEFAVLAAETDRAPTDNVGELLDDLRARVFPIIEETQRTMTALADLVESLNDPNHPLQRSMADVATLTAGAARGEGAVGRLLTDDTAVREVEATLAIIRGQLIDVSLLLESLTTTGDEVAGLAGALADADTGVPAIIGDTRAAIADARRAMPGLVTLADNAGSASEDLPLLLSQMQVTLQELENLLVVLQGNWLIGGQGRGAAGPPGGDALAPGEIRP